MELISLSIPFPFPSTLLLFLFAILIFFLLIMFLKSLIQTISNTAKAYSHFPGPTPLPLIGNLHLMLTGAAPHRLLNDLAAKYGPLFHLQLGEIPFLIISSTDLAKQVIKTHDVNFANRPPGLVPEFLVYNDNDVIFSPYGDYWRQLKKICTLELLSARRVHLFRSIREEENLNMARSVASCEGSPVDLSEELHLSSYGVITRAVVGAKTEERAMVASILEEAAKIAAGFKLADLYPSIKSLPLITGARSKLRRMHRKLDEMFDTIIEQHRSAAKRMPEDEDLVDVLLKIQADGSDHMPLTDDNIKGVLMDMFVAGTHPSAITVEWAMSEMIRNPSKLNKAQEEVRRVFDDEKYIDEGKFEELKYLKLIIKETLRLHPPGTLLMPKVNTERCEINGYEIPAKSRVIVNAWALGRDPEYWKEPEKFEPERFEDSSIDFKGNNLNFIPFGAGRRMCPGITFALANIEFPLAMLLYHFDWKMPFGLKNEELDMTDGSGSSVSRKNHLVLIPVVKRPLA